MKSSGGFLLLLIAGCAGSPDPAPGDASAITVGVRPVALDSISEVLTLSGTLTPMPGGSALLAAPVDAVVQTIAVRLGQQVHPGDLLLQLDAPELVTAASSLAAQARADSIDLERQRDLYQQGITARRQLDEREASAAGTRAQAVAASQLLQRARVRSPLAGGVQRLLVQVGERVSAGQPLVEVVDGTGLDFHAGVAATTIGSIRTGQQVSVGVEGTGARVEGRVVGIAPAIDSSTGLGEIVVHIPVAGNLRAGSGAQATLLLHVVRGVLVLSDSALVPAGRGVQVFVVGPDSLAHARAVTVLVRNAGRVAVTGELNANDLVVVTGAYGLSDSTRVLPLPEP